MTELNDDKGTKEILKNSYLELSDPEFRDSVMRKVARAARTRNVMKNILLNLLVFTAIDMLVILALWITGMNVGDLGSASFNLLNGILSGGARYGASIAGSTPSLRTALSVVAVTAAFVLIEILLSARKESRRHLS